MSLNVVVPKMPPAIDGVGDYSNTLFKKLRAESHIDCAFVICDPQWPFSKDSNFFKSHQLKKQTQKDLLEFLPTSYKDSIIVVLQFSGYGYAKWGCPFWLVDGLTQWKAQSPNHQLITMFHELYNHCGAPWQHSFWVSHLQKKIASQLAVLSDVCLTNTQQSAAELTHLSAGKHAQVPVLPVFSNVGEPSQVSPLLQRQRRMVVFGQGGTRQRAYVKAQAELLNACQQLGIEEIWDIGPSIDLPDQLGNVSIRQLGEQPESAISYILQNSYAGFLEYNPNMLAKSGVFAAYCAHGLVPVHHSAGTPGQDSLIAGRQYWVPNFKVGNFQSIADAAFSWYQQHNLATHAQTIAKLIGQSASISGQ